MKRLMAILLNLASKRSATPTRAFKPRLAELAGVPYERLLATTVSVRTDYTPLQGRSSK